MSAYTLTDMKKLLVVLDDETSKVLEREINKSRFVREAVKYVSMDITPDTIEGMRSSYLMVAKQLKEIDSKLDYIAGRIKT